MTCVSGSLLKGRQRRALVVVAEARLKANVPEVDGPLGQHLPLLRVVAPDDVGHAEAVDELILATAHIHQPGTM